MIPRKIHYCWLSEEPYPEKIRQCLDSWKEKLSDYEIVKWDLNRFPIEKCKWVQQAYEARKFAFAADYIRLYALAVEGGIYLDSDVEVLKPFDDLLNLPYFVCKENSPQGIEAATIGAEKGCEWIKKCLEYYNNRDFIDKEGRQSTTVLPSIMMSILSKNYIIKEIDNHREVYCNTNCIYLLPSTYFSPKNYVNKKIEITNQTYSIHHFAGTWQPLWKRFLLLIWVPFSVKFPKITHYIKSLWKHD